MSHNQQYTRFISHTFRDLPVGITFRTTPSETAYEWQKVSTRTGKLRGTGTSYYFGQRDRVHVRVAHWNQAQTARATPSTVQTQTNNG